MADGRPGTTLPVRLTWPGVDRDRAIGACFHLTRVCEQLRRAALMRRHGHYPVTQLNAARVGLRIARGYLGAIGFERGGRL